MSRRNWAAHYRSLQTRQSRAFAEGQHRPPPLIVGEHDAGAQQPTQDTDQRAEEGES
jgi:hypothetical protein